MRAGIAVVGLALVTGCASFGGWGVVEDAPPDEAPAGPRAAVRLGLGEWDRGVLHCDAGLCDQRYRLSLAEAGDLHVEIRSAAGPDVPDFDVRLEDEAGEVLWGFAPTAHSPREIQRMLAPGDYYVVLESIGENRGPLVYEALARLEKPGPVFRPPQPKIAGPGSKRSSRRPEKWMSADIVQVEGQAGRPSVVVLDGGALHDLAVGYRGELVEGSSVIGTFELVEVGESRSRGRLDAAPRRAITFETRARVRVPLE